MFDFKNLQPVSDPWGPSESTPEDLKFNNVPYAPFLKTDKLGKIADWHTTPEEPQPKRKDRDQFHAYGASAAKLFGVDIDNKGFVESGVKHTVLKGKQPVKRKPFTQTATKKPVQQQRWQQVRETIKRESSIKISADWAKIEEIELIKLTKLNLTVPEGEVVATSGEIRAYNKKYDGSQITKLATTDKKIIYQSTSEDPIMQKLASEGKADLFATAEIISQIMCAPKSYYSWDVIVKKVNGVVFLDKREGSYKLEVDENVADGPDVLNAAKLAEEAQLVNDEFLATSLGAVVQKEAFASPITDSSAISRGYKYVKYTLPSTTKQSKPLAQQVSDETDDVEEDETPKGFTVIVRAPVDAMLGSTPIALHALHQHLSSDWTSSFQGSIIMDQIKRNNNKISQWTTQALLSNTETMKLAFVSRAPVQGHLVARVETQMVNILASQINLNLGSGWATVKSLVDMLSHWGGDESQSWEGVVVKLANVQKLAVFGLSKE